MGQRPNDRKKLDAFHAATESFGSIFDDDTFEDVETAVPDPIFKMRKAVIHFRMMVLLPEFKYIHKGSILTYSQPGNIAYPEGVVLANGFIHIPNQNGTVKSLTAFASACFPFAMRKTKTGSVTRVSPDGWERVWVTLDNNQGSMKMDDLLFKHHADLGYTVEELANLEYIYSEMKRRGYADQIADIETDLKAWRTASKKKSEKVKNDKHS